MEDLSTADEDFGTNLTTSKEEKQAAQGNMLHDMIKPLPDETAPRIAEYLGSFPVTGRTPEERATYVGKQLELISKGEPAKLKMVCIAMTLGGVKICDPTMKETYMSHALRRISYTTCVPQEHILAFVSRNPGEPLTNQYCHTFRTEHASEINSIIGGAFLTAYTLKRRKKKRLSLEITSPDDAGFESNTSGNTNESENTCNEPSSPSRSFKTSQTKCSGSDISYDENKEFMKNKPRDALSQLESRVFAAVNERAQSRERTESDAVNSRRSPPDRSMHRIKNTRRPISYHESSNLSRKAGIKQLLRQQDSYHDSAPNNDESGDFNISNLRILHTSDTPSIRINDEDDLSSNISRQDKSMSLGQGARNTKLSESYARLKEGDRRPGGDLDTIKSSKAGGGGCSPAQALSGFLPFRLGKKKKKKYTRSKTESVLVADRTFDRLWSPRQRLNTSDNNVPFHQRTEIIPTSSMLNIGLQPTDSRIRRSLAENYPIDEGATWENRQFSDDNYSLSESPSRQRLNLRSPVQLLSETIGSGTTSSSSCPSSNYSNETACEDSGMYTQSSNASSSSSGSCSKKSTRSSNTDSLQSGSDVWFPKHSTSLVDTIAELDSPKYKDGRLRRSFAAQMISADNFVSLDSKLMNAAWYHPALPIDVAMGILRTEQDGSFLLIRPIRKGASYTLVVSCRGSCKLFNINKIEKVGYHIEGRNQFFPHVYILIAQYSCHPGPLPFKLKTMQLFNPLCKDKVEQ
uniref:uncharacterized protein LOC120344795 n=1 Tax=Styela clava TaxID=7725 RepID=UPI001939D691|nr:uncharacterized protein LOC120344795 [Styela clava]